MCFVPFFFEIPKTHFSLLGGWGLVYRLKIPSHLFALFPENIFQGIAHHVDDTELHLGLGEYRFYGLKKRLLKIQNTGKQSDREAAYSDMLFYAAKVVTNAELAIAVIADRDRQAC